MNEIEEQLIDAFKSKRITNPKDLIDLYKKFESILPNNISEASAFINDRKQDIIDRVINSNDSRLYSLLIDVMFLTKNSLLKESEKEGLVNICKIIPFVLYTSTYVPIRILGFPLYLAFSLARIVLASAFALISPIGWLGYVLDGGGSDYFEFIGELWCSISGIGSRVNSIESFHYANEAHKNLGKVVIGSVINDSKSNNELYITIVSIINEIILNDKCSESFLYYISTINNYYNIFSPEASEKVKKYIEELDNNKTKFKSLNKDNSKENYYKLLFKTFDFKNEITNSQIFESNSFEKLDVIEVNNVLFPVMYLADQKLFSILDSKNIKEIEYGIYPYGFLSSIQSKILNKAYKLKILNKTGKMYRMLSNAGVIVSYPEYEFYGKKFIKIKNNWIEVLPIKWRVDKGLNCLVFDEMKLSNRLFHDSKSITTKQIKNYICNIFAKDIEVGTNKDREDELNIEIEKMSEQLKAEAALKQKAKEEKERQEKLDVAREELLKAIEKMDLATQSVDSAVQTFNNLYTDDDLKETFPFIKQISRIKNVRYDVFSIWKDDHYEIIPEFVSHLKYIDFSCYLDQFLYSLKISGIDWSETNIQLDPQKVYKKDLSRAKFSDANLFGSFRGVNLCGSDISDEEFPIEIDKAIIDEKTKLPKRESISFGI